jgi:hypothetical protein
MCTQSFFTSNIFAAIIGGAIGFFSSIFTSIFYNGHQARIIKYEDYMAWCNGVKAEINHLLKVISEISSILDKGIPCTKRLNHDYLEQARIKIPSFESDLKFLETLTNAYRDIIHTNNMLDRLERDFGNRPQIIGNVVASIDGVKKSVQSLNTGLDTKLSKIKMPHWYSFKRKL